MYLINFIRRTYNYNKMGCNSKIFYFDLQLLLVPQEASLISLTLGDYIWMWAFRFWICKYYEKYK